MPLTPDEVWSSLTESERAAAVQAINVAHAVADQMTGQRPQLAAVPDPGPPELEGEAVDDYTDLADFAEDFLRVSFKGEHYDIPACDIETGLLCQRLMGVGARVRSGRTPTARQQDQLNDAEETELFIDLLGGRQVRQVDPLTAICPMCAAGPRVPCRVGEDDDPTNLDVTEDGDYVHPLRGQVPNPHYDPTRDLWSRVKDEGRSWPFVQHLGTTAIFWAAFGADTALEFWQSGGRPKPRPAPAPRAPQDRKPAARKATATKTRKRASGTGTKRTT